MGRLGQQSSDSELLDLIKGEDEAAFRLLYDRYWAPIYSTAFSYLHDREASAEIVHDIFLSIWLKRSTLEIASFYHYCTAATRYQVYKRIKQMQASAIIYSDGLEESAALQTGNQGEYDIRFRDLQESVEASLMSLPQRCREIYHLSRKEQLSIAEIAQRLGISKRTVENQLTRALQHLRHNLGDLHTAWIVIGALWVRK